MLADDSPLRHTLEQVEQAARRSAELANQMLAYSGKGKFVIQPMALSELVQGIAELIQGTISKKADTNDRLRRGYADHRRRRDATAASRVSTSSPMHPRRSGTSPARSRSRPGRWTLDKTYLADFEHTGVLPSAWYTFLEVSDS